MAEKKALTGVFATVCKRAARKVAHTVAWRAGSKVGKSARLETSMAEKLANWEMTKVGCLVEKLEFLLGLAS